MNVSEMRLRANPGARSALGLHLAWCPKYRRRILTGSVAERLETLLSDLFVVVGPTDAPAEVVRLFKGRTSRVLRQEFGYLARSRVLWSKSYFASSAMSLRQR
jgi:putative transposase